MNRAFRWPGKFAWPTKAHGRVLPDEPGVSLVIVGHRWSSLAREICRRGEFFFDIWINQEDEKFLYTEEHLHAYEEKLPWLDFVASKGVTSDAFIRALEVRNTFPINPEWVD